MLYFCTLTLLAVIALLVAEYRDWRPGVWVAKPLAGAGFIGAALAAAALDSGYGRWILAALVLSWFGDVFLIPRRAPRVFQAGILSFLLGHVAFTAAFVVRGLDLRMALLTALIALVTGLLAARWLRPHVPAQMRIPVHAYLIVISLMLVCAAAATASSGDARILLGALMFYASDLSVARDRFVVPQFTNRAWGLPLYFAAQLVLATSVA